MCASRTLLSIADTYYRAENQHEIPFNILFKKKEKKRKENLPHIELAEQRSALKAMIRVLKGNI